MSLAETMQCKLTVLLEDLQDWHGFVVQKRSVPFFYRGYSQTISYIRCIKPEIKPDTHASMTSTVWVVVHMEAWGDSLNKGPEIE